MMVLKGGDVLAPFTGHGGQLSQARALYPDALLPWIDLSTGIAPWPYPIPPLSVECWSRLPEPDALDALILAARTCYGVPPDAHIVPVPGTDLAIGLIPRLVPKPSRVAIVSPTYASHAQAWRAAGHDVEPVSGVFDLEGSEIGVLVNPNNPDGQAWTAQPLPEIADQLAARGGFLLVDEAFADVCPGTSVLRSNADLSATLVLRSFGKFFGLAGIRLGFAISSHPIINAIAQTVSAWPVSGPATVIGAQALSDQDWIAIQQTRLASASRNLVHTLTDAGLSIVGGTDLFQLVAHPAGGQLFHYLAVHGILVRPFEDGVRLRFGLPASNVEFDRLSTALASWKSGSSLT